MPITVIDIERTSSRKIAVMFVFMLAVYLFIVLVLLGLPALLTGRAVSLCTPSNILFVVLSSAFLAGLHFWLSASNAVSMVIAQLGATLPDKDDGIHRQLLNVTAEINIASGRTRPIRCLVAPSLSMNALAVADLRGEAAIVITEGLLSRLTRSQVEAVLAHEAYHVLSGDCLETSVAASLFGIHASAVEGLSRLIEEDLRAIPFVVLYWLLIKFGLILNMFISREREYRADAAAVRMTRDPLSMAEALYAISRNWTGTGIISSGLEMLCIISPEGEAASGESEGWMEDLFSTHPPLRKRIAGLLKMARLSAPQFEKRMASRKGWPVPQDKTYFALDPKNSWIGPLGHDEMTALPWLTPLTWIVEGSSQSAVRVSELPELKLTLPDRTGPSPSLAADFVCPSCRYPLYKTDYEHTSVFQCRFCGGVLVETGKLPRIIARQEMPCTERIIKLARAVIADNQRKRSALKRQAAKPAFKSGMNCSKCGHPMFRTFYSFAYLIEIDRCGICKLTWFDRDELEMLQCLLENRIAVRIGAPPDSGETGPNIY